MNKINITKNEKTAEIVGLCFGDGSLTKRKEGRLRFQMRGNIKEDKEHYDLYIKPLFDKVIGKVNLAVYNGRKPYYGIATENQERCTYLNLLGVPVGIKRELAIPIWISSDDNYLKCFLRGFIDTDGSVFCGKDYNYPEKGHIKIRMSIISTSKNLIKEINQALSNIGIKNLIIKRYKQRLKNWSNFYKIQIDGPNVVRYFKLIGSNNPKHITKFNVWAEFGYCPPYTTLGDRKNMLAGLNRPLANSSANSIIQYAGVAELAKCANSSLMKRRVEGLVP